MNTDRRFRLLTLLVTWLLAGGVYYGAAKLSLHLAIVGKSVTPLWPPTGIALVTFLIFGFRVWPAIAAAAFLVNWPISSTAGVAGIIAAGNTLAPAFAAGLLKISKFREELDRTRDAIALVVLAALMAMTVSATIGSYALRWSGAIRTEALWSTWAVWWAGDAMGVLAIAPFLLGLRSIRRGPRPSWARALEGVLLFGALIATSSLIAVTSRPVWVAVFPLLVLIAWRFQQRGSGLAALIVIMSASWVAAHNDGPFMGADLLQTMVSLQVFNAAVALTSFFFAAVVAERIEARKQLEQSAKDLYQREHAIAETLQRSLLPGALPTNPDLVVSARYIPASTDVEIGGDWYDMISLADGRLGLAIGDVAGHGVAAAAAMGQIRMALRAYGMEGITPGLALERLNSLIIELQPGTMVTLLYAHIDPDSGSLVFARAGHPPPLIVTPGRTPTFLSDGLAPPLGVSPYVSYIESRAKLDPDSTLVLYTDGLIERRGESIDTGLERLARTASKAPGDLEEASDHILATLIGDGASDDTALLLIRRLALAGRPFVVDIPADPGRLVGLRRVFGRWLRQNGIGESDIAEVLLATTEAGANAIQHAYRAGPGEIHIEAMTDQDVLVVTVKDFGSWKLGKDVHHEDRGRGLLLMRSVMDTVDVHSGAEGTEVVMKRRIDALVPHA